MSRTIDFLLSRGGASLCASRGRGASASSGSSTGAVAVQAALATNVSGAAPGKNAASLASVRPARFSREPSTDEGSMRDHGLRSTDDDEDSLNDAASSSDSSSSDEDVVDEAPECAECPSPAKPASRTKQEDPSGEQPSSDTTAVAPPTPSGAWMRIRTPSPETRRAIMQLGLLPDACLDLVADSPTQMASPVVGGASSYASPMPCSAGSAGHPFCCAEPCKFARTRRGCRDGADCDRCHLCVWRKPLGSATPRVRRRGKAAEAFPSECGAE